MKKLAFILSVTMILGFTSLSNATLWDRGGGLIYDDDLGITWLQDANYAKTSNYDADGLMSWGAANGWANGLVYRGYDDWRLPTTGNWQEGEMGHLFHSELGGVEGQSILTTHNPNYDLFTNLQPYAYWTGFNYGSWSGTCNYYSYFDFSCGSQGNACVDSDFYAWAVRDGDVPDVRPHGVPEPATMLLLGLGLIGVAGVRRRMS